MLLVVTLMPLLGNPTQVFLLPLTLSPKTGSPCDPGTILYNIIKTMTERSEPPDPLDSLFLDEDDNDREQPRLFEPLPLHPLHPIILAQRVQRRIRSRNGETHSRLVLQPIATSPDTISYAFTRLLYEEPKRNLTISLATPKITTKDGCSPRLITCGPPVVIKAVPKATIHNTSFSDNPLEECAAMHLLMKYPPHPNVIRIQEVMQDDDFLYLILPYLSGGDLFAAVENTQYKGLPMDKATKYFAQIVEVRRRQGGLIGLKDYY